VFQSRENANLAKPLVLSEMHQPFQLQLLRGILTLQAQIIRMTKVAQTLWGIKCSTKVRYHRTRKTKKMPQGSSYRAICRRRDVQCPLIRKVGGE
jgi:hypothetical protein